ncbi:hypothetical protein CBD41_00830 [bacterium TMED181]|nr:hypothetical protein [Planctomycetota bacterium]OUW47527.1 MAG: hypothetical protein CBD41_00830 [bacterium TMED181]
MLTKCKVRQKSTIIISSADTTMLWQQSGHSIKSHIPENLPFVDLNLTRVYLFLDPEHVEALKIYGAGHAM